MTSSTKTTKDPTQQRIERLERTVDVLRYYLIETLKINKELIEMISYDNPGEIPLYKQTNSHLAALETTSTVSK